MLSELISLSVDIIFYAFYDALRSGVLARQDKVNSITNDVTACFGKPHTKPEAMERRAPLCTNYRLRVCLCSSLTDSLADCLRLAHTHTHKVHDIHMHSYIHAHRHGQRVVLNRHRCKQTDTFLWVVSCWCVTVCLWHSGSHRRVLLLYVCLRFPENMPTHAPHFRGV